MEIQGLTEGTPSCPWRSGRVPPGSYAVKVTHPGYVPTTELIDVEAGQPFALEVALQRDPDAVLSAATAGPRRPFRPWPWAALAGSAASIGVGAGFTIGAVNERDTAESLPPGGERDEAVDAFETKRAVSYVFYGVGGALAATGIALFFLTGNDEDDRENDEGMKLDVTAQGLKVTF